MCCNCVIEEDKGGDDWDEEKKDFKFMHFAREHTAPSVEDKEKVTVAAPFDRPDGRDLEETGGSLGSPDPSGVRDTPFGSLIPAPPVGPPPSGGAAAHTDALLRQLVHEHNALVQNFDAALADRTDRYVRDANLGLGRVRLIFCSLQLKNLFSLQNRLYF